RTSTFPPSLHDALPILLFDPLSAALGAATGELVFSEIMLGQFGGLGELEKFITVTIGVYIAGRMVKDPTNRKMVGIAAITGTARSEEHTSELQSRFDLV